jgi:transitional endoplasmic reticulum ATPase
MNIARELVEHSADFVKKAVDEATLGNQHDARRSYLQAAELLFKSADLSLSPIREKRANQASKLLELARVIPGDVLQQSAKEIPISANGEDEQQDWLLAEKPDVTLDHVAGLYEAKEQVRLRMIYPFVYPSHAERLGMKKGGGILLFGPPGTGKTLLAKAIAGEVDAAFYCIDSADIMGKWVGEAEKNVSKLFSEARRHIRCVVFIDEIEALLPKRSQNNSTVMKRVVPQFLSEMNGVISRERDQHALLFVGATNEPWNIDEAAMRPGRFDEKVYVALPDQEARFTIIKDALAKVPGAAGIDCSGIAVSLEGYSGADIVQVIERAKQFAFADAVHSGMARDLRSSDIEQAMTQVRPSVTEKMLDRYREFMRDP